MSTHTTAEQAAAIAAACGLAGSGASFLATGATSEVWELSTLRERFALRLAIPNPEERNAYEAGFAIRRLLTDLDGRVARPIYTNQDVDAGVDIAWCLDNFVDGEIGTRGGLPERACHDLGATLALLHGLPVEGHGLLQNRRDRLVGSSANARDGLLTRLEAPWPFADRPLEQHPLAAAAPDLVPLLAPLESRLLALLADGSQRSVVHTDLHTGQLALADDRLQALLDFGDAVAGPAAWDIGSFGYFHGWELTRHLIEAYTGDPSDRENLLEEARLFAVIIAIHHAGRAEPLRQPQRMAGAVRYLRANLPA